MDRAENPKRVSVFLCLAPGFKSQLNRTADQIVNVEVSRMFSSNRLHPIMDVYVRTKDLISTMKTSLAQIETVLGPRSMDMVPLQSQESSFKELYFTVRAEVGVWKEDGEISEYGMNQIHSLFNRFIKEFNTLTRVLESRNARLADKLIKQARRDVNRLKEAIKKLDLAVKSHQVRLVKRHTEFPEEFPKIRYAMAKLDPQAAQDLKGMDVDRWCSLPGVDLEDRKQIDTIAKVILAKRVPDQSFELRVRSKAPGQPLLLAKRLYYLFATEEDVFKIAHLWGNPDRIFVTASKPSFRIVWVFDRERVGW